MTGVRPAGLYEQYLRETGEAPAPVGPRSLAEEYEEFLRQEAARPPAPKPAPAASAPAAPQAAPPPAPTKRKARIAPVIGVGGMPMLPLGKPPETPEARAEREADVYRRQAAMAEGKARGAPIGEAKEYRGLGHEVGRSLKSTAGGALGFAGQLADMAGFEDIGTAAIRKASEIQAANPAQVPSFRDAMKTGHYARYLAGISGNAAYMIPIVGGTIGGTALATRLGAAAATAARVGQATGLATSMGMGTGEVRGEMDELGNVQEGRDLLALMGGAAIGALDYILPGRVAERVVRGTAPATAVSHSIAQAIRRGAVVAGKETLTEGGTEGAQELIGYGVSRIGSDQPVTLEEAWQRASEGAIAGGIIGGGVSATSQAYEGGMPRLRKAGREAVKGAARGLTRYRERVRQAQEKAAQEAVTGVPTPQAVPTEPQAPPQPAQPSAEPQGVQTVTFSTGRKVPVRYRVVDADALQSSHDPYTFQKNPNYPEGVQGRSYEADQLAQEGVKARAQMLDPDLVLDLAGTPDKGPPLVTPTGLVIAGNERSMLLRRAAQLAPERYERYRRQLIDRARAYGLDPEQVIGMKNPVLVREIQGGPELMDPNFLRELNRESDITGAKTMRWQDKAGTMARKMAETGKVLQHFSTTFGPEDTVLDYLGRPEGREFVDQLVRDGVITQEEEAELRTEVGGPLTEEGKLRIKRLVVAAALPDGTQTIDRAPAAVMAKLESALPHIVAARTVQDFDIRETLDGALSLMASAQEQNLTLDALIDQLSLFDQESRPVKLARWLARAKKAEVTDAFRRYATIARESTGMKEDMFGGMAPSQEEAFLRLVSLPEQPAPPPQAKPKREKKPKREEPAPPPPPAQPEGEFPTEYQPGSNYAEQDGPPAAVYRATVGEMWAIQQSITDAVDQFNDMTEKQQNSKRGKTLQKSIEADQAQLEGYRAELEQAFGETWALEAMRLSELDELPFDPEADYADEQEEEEDEARDDDLTPEEQKWEEENARVDRILGRPAARDIRPSPSYEEAQDIQTVEEGLDYFIQLAVEGGPAFKEVGEAGSFGARAALAAMKEQGATDAEILEFVKTREFEKSKGIHTFSVDKPGGGKAVMNLTSEEKAALASGGGSIARWHDYQMLWRAGIKDYERHAGRDKKKKVPLLRVTRYEQKPNQMSGYDYLPETVEGSATDVLVINTFEELVPLVRRLYGIGEATPSRTEVGEGSAVDQLKAAKTGEPWSATVLRGEGGTRDQPRGPDALLGAARYGAIYREHAQEFADDDQGNVVGKVYSYRASLDNPLVIDNDTQWRELTAQAGWPYPNPGPYQAGTNEERLARRRNIAALRRLIEGMGYDGVIVRIPTWMHGDVRLVDERTAKTLGRVFGGSQVIEFNPQGPSGPPGRFSTLTAEAPRKAQPDLFERTKADQGEMFGGEEVGQTRDTPTAPGGTGPQLPGAITQEEIRQRLSQGESFQADEFATETRDEEGQGTLLAPTRGRKAELTRKYTDIVTDQEDGPGLLPNDDHAVICTNNAHYVVDTEGQGRVVGYVDSKNPSAMATGKRQEAIGDAYDGDIEGHDFAIVDDRYIVDPWVVNYGGTADQAVFDLYDPADQAEIRRLYGDPATWEQSRGEKVEGSLADARAKWPTLDAAGYTAESPVSPVNRDDDWGAKMRKLLGIKAGNLGKAKTERQIARELIKGMYSALRGGPPAVYEGGKRVGKAALGHFGLYDERIRMHRINHIGTLAHEFGHFISKTYFGWPTRKGKTKAKFARVNPNAIVLSKDSRTELESMGHNLYGSRKPTLGYGEEGIAEAFKFFVTDPDRLHREAPTFELQLKEMFRQNPAFAAPWIQAQKDYAAFLASPLEERLRAKITFDPHKRHLFSSDDLMRFIAEEDWEFRKAVRELVEMLPGPLQAVANPYLLSRLFKGLGARSDNIIHNGYVETSLAPDGKTVIVTRLTRPLKEAIDAIPTGELEAFAAYLTGMSALDRYAFAVGRSLGKEPGTVTHADILALSKEQRAELELQYKNMAGGVGYGDVGVTIDEAEAGTQKYHDRYQAIAEIIWENEAQAIKERVKAGTLTEAQGDRILLYHPHHVPFARDISDDPGQASVNRTSLLPKGVARQTGGGSNIINPLEGVLRNVYETQRDIGRHRTMEALAKLALENEGGSRLWTEVPNPKEHVRIRLSQMSPRQIIDALTELGLELPKNEDGEALTGTELREWLAEHDDIVFDVFMNIRTPRHGEQEEMVFPVQIGEQRRWVQMNPAKRQLYNDLMGLTIGQREMWGRIMQSLAKVSRGVQVGATSTIQFGIRNIIRDIQTAMMYTRVRAGVPMGNGKVISLPGQALAVAATRMVKGLGHLLKRDDIFDLYQLSSGDLSTLLQQDMQGNYTQRLRELYAERGAAPMVKYFLRHPIEFLRLIGSASEQANRIGEFEVVLKRALKAGVALPDALVKAGFAAREVTQDFSKMGALTRAVNMVIPFAAARTGGLVKFGEEIGRLKPEMRSSYLNENMGEWDRAQEFLASAVMSITIPSLLIYLLQKDDEEYQKVPRWVKNVSWPIMVGGGYYVPIPKPPLIGTLFGTIPELMAERALEGGKNDPLEQMLIVAAQEGIPWRPWDFAPTKPLFENWANRSIFFQTAIESPAVQGQASEYRYSPKTSEAMIALAQSPIGDAIRAIYGGETFAGSPAKLENLVRGYGAGIGGYALGAADLAVKSARAVAGKPPIHARGGQRDVPITDKLMFTQGLIGKVGAETSPDIQNFYKRFKELEQKRNRWRELRESSPAEGAAFRAANRNDLRLVDAENKKDGTSTGAWRKAMTRINELQAERRALAHKDTEAAFKKRQRLGELMQEEAARALKALEK